MLRVLGYGSILFVLVMIQLPLRDQMGYGLLTSIVAGTSILVGTTSLVLLISQPETSRRESWITSVLLYVLLFALLIPVLRMD